MDCARSFPSQHCGHIIDGDRSSSGAMVGQELIHSLGGESLESSSPRASYLVRDFGRGASKNDRGRCQQPRYLGTVHGVVGDGAFGVGSRPPDDGGGLVGCHAQGDGVAVALGHLAAVKAGQLGGLGYEPRWLGENLSVAFIEPARDRSGDFDVREVVFPDRDQVALAEQNEAPWV